MKFKTTSSGSATILANFSLTMLKAFLVLAFIGLMLMSLELKKQSQEGIKPPIFLIVTATWPNEIDVDVDLHVRCPNGDLINYVIRESCWASLERDARGSVSDFMNIQNTKVVKISNRESVSFRTPYAGEWAINIQWYSGYSGSPVPVKLEVMSLEPVVKLIYEKTVYLNHYKHEQHVVMFNIDDNKTVTNFDETKNIKMIRSNINTAPGMLR